MKFLKKIFGGKEEEAFKNFFLEESKLTCESVYKLVELLNLLVNGKSIESVAERINELEREVDKARTKAESEIYKGSFLPFARADRLELLEDIDTIADIAEEIAILLRIKKIKIVSKKDIKEFANSLKRTADILWSLLEFLTKNVDEFLNFYELLRERRRDTKGKIYKIYEALAKSKSIPAIDADITMELLRKALVMCRKFDDVADRARAMVIKYL